MTSRSLGDDRSPSRTNDADVAPHVREPERVVSEGFVDAILSIAEHQAEASERRSLGKGADGLVEVAVSTTPVAARVASDDFIDAVLEVAETRVASAAAAEQERAEQQSIEQASTESKVTPRRAPQPERHGDQRIDRASLRTDRPDQVTDRRDRGTLEAKRPALPGGRGGGLDSIPLDETVGQLRHDRDEDDFRVDASGAISLHVHPTRPTPWWRKRPSLEIIFAVIATVLMVVGLALVIAELF